MARDTKDSLPLEIDPAAILRASPVGVFVVDAAGAPVFTNDAAEAILGRGAVRQASPGQLAEVYAAVVEGTEEPYPADRMPLVRGLSGETSSVSDMVVLRPTGPTHLEVHGAPLRGPEDQVVGSVATFLDDTARFEAERALEVERARYRRIFDVSPVPMWEEGFGEVVARLEELRDAGVEDLGAYFDEHAHELPRLAGSVEVLDVNEAALALHGADSKEQLLGELSKVFVPESLATFRNQLEAIFAGESRFVGEGEVGTLSGERRVVHVHLSLLSRSPAVAVVATPDVTELRHLEERRGQLERLGALGRMVAGVAHELNNPLMALVNFAQFCQGEVEEGTEVRQVLGDIEREARKCTTVVEGLLEFARPGSADRTTRSAAVGDSVERIVRVLEHRANKEGVELEVSVDDDLDPVAIDADSLEQVLLNLLVNAVDAVETTSRKVVRLRARREGAGVTITVEDSGEGMPESVKRRAFEPFFSTKEPGKGTGLGLSTCWSILRKYGGELRLASTPGEGTLATVVLEPAEGRS